MAAINWNSNLSVNVAELDEQHKKLIAVINELNDAMRVGKGRDALGKIVNDLTTYATTHFGAEEEYFVVYRYPEAESQEREHAFFVHKVAEIKEGLKKGKLSITLEAMDFLSNWLKNHIMVVDKKYGPFFNEKGLK
jgi:hemerythrin